MDAPPQPRTGTNLRRGGLALAIAKLFFLLSGYAISIALTRLVEPATFGLYGVVSMVIAVPNMVLIQTILFTVSRPMAAEVGRGLASYGALRRRGFRLAAILGGAVCLVFWTGAEVIATRFFRDPALTLPLRTVAPIPVIYALYAVNIGTLNATRRFGLQATLDMFMAATKAGLIVGAALLGWELARILGGFTVAAGLALTLSVILVALARPGRSEASGEGTSASPAGAPTTSTTAATGSLWRLAGSLLVFTAAVNLLLALDLLILTR
ncbi:MAG: oligosaccharide flippase family protein, partial [Nannocystaceae bacterium]